MPVDEAFKFRSSKVFKLLHSFWTDEVLGNSNPAYMEVNMSAKDETILIIDEAGFSRICSAILEMMGYAAETVPNCKPYCLESITKKHKLVITSYPFCMTVYSDIKNMDVPLIILSDHINNELIDMLEDKKNTYCMMKPLDYQKFKCLISQTMMGRYDNSGGYKIV